MIHVRTHFGRTCAHEVIAVNPSHPVPMPSPRPLLFSFYGGNILSPPLPPCPTPLQTWKADETQANLAFVALRQEPFLVEELDYLANQIRDLHQVTSSKQP